MLGEDAPDLARVLDLRLADFQIVHGDALAVEHAEDVVVGLDEQRGGIRERLVVGKPGRLGVPVRADDGQVFYLCVQGAGDS